MSGPEVLRSVALEAARQWRFSALTVGNRSVPYQITLTFYFTTRGPGSGQVRAEP